MLEYLVASRARRELLLLLWAQGQKGSVSALARRCGLSFTATYRELEAMAAAGLALAERQGAALEYRADRRHPQGKTLLALLTPTDQEVKGRDEVAVTPSGTEVALVNRLVASHLDRSVALGLPAILWRQREEFNHGRLIREATRRTERQSLGLFLQLAGQLSGDRRNNRQVVCPNAAANRSSSRSRRYPQRRASGSDWAPDAPTPGAK